MEENKGNFLNDRMIASEKGKEAQKKLDEAGDLLLRDLGLTAAYEKLLRYHESMPGPEQMVDRLRKIQNAPWGEGHPSYVEKETDYLRGESRLIASELLQLMVRIKDVEMRRIADTEDVLLQTADDTE